ncbi:cory-CC-star protein [Rubrobacter aplysinae]|uniref:cory-CC-star protein n=1 Tax=Rubrobacter aplysinae TaxID=909625 RepID=UPI0019100A3A|nr:cory-CC-star protein [Rubrobacter aplysinae]
MSPEASRLSALLDWRAIYGKIEELHREFFVSKWRAGMQREAGQQQDALMAMLFLEALGVPSPTSYYTLELYPEFVESFHRWHLRMGIQTFPDGGFCC